MHDPCATTVFRGKRRATPRLSSLRITKSLSPKAAGELSTPLHKFAHVFQAARAIGWDGSWSRWTSLFSSSRVNFHSKGLAIAS